MVVVIAVLLILKTMTLKGKQNNQTKSLVNLFNNIRNTKWIIKNENENLVTDSKRKILSYDIITCSWKIRNLSSFSPHPHQHLLFLIFLIITILTSVRCYLIVVLVCISLIVNDVGHLFMHLLAILNVFFEKMSMHFLPPILTKLFAFCHWVLWTIYIFWILARYLSRHLQIFSLIS